MPVFETVLKMNIAASLTAAAVLTVKYILERLGMPRRVLFLLWLVIAFRLVCPAAPQSRLSVMNLFARETTVEQSAVGAADAIGAADADGANYAADAADDPGKTPVLPDAIAVTWFCGVSAMLVYGLMSYARLKRRLRFAVKYSGNVYFADDIPTAFVLGILCPKIYIPSGTERLEYVIEHEKTHIRRLDHISKLFAYALLSGNWFNPINWLLFRRFSDDIELACDECVTARLDTAKRKEYMNALLDAATGKTGVKIPYHVCFSENITKRRIKAMLNVKKLSIPVMVMTVICCTIVGAAFGTSAVTAEQPSVHQIAEPTEVPKPTDAYAAQSTEAPKTDHITPEPEPDNDNKNPADESMKMPDVPYNEPVPDNADMMTEADDGGAGTENAGGGTVPAMRMPDGAADVPRPPEQGMVLAENETNTANEQENPEPDHAENDTLTDGTTDVYTSDVSRDDVTGIEMGASREDVYSALGVPAEPYSNSAREEYSLDDGDTAVLIFDENNQLERGYIAEK